MLAKPPVASRLLDKLQELGLPAVVSETLRYGVERTLGISDPLTPPRALRRLVGPFDDARHYREVARSVFRHYVDECGLKPSDGVLDLGCGCGQMAAPLTEYLSRSASYEGFDINPPMIDWCTRHITPRFPNFRFQCLSIANTYYRPDGKLNAANLAFPYRSASFDYVFAKSLFTHLLPAESDNYLAETARVLRRGGRAWMSFFLLNSESLAAIEQGRSTLDFRHVRDGYRAVNAAQPGKVVAHDQAAVEALFEKHGFELLRAPSFGSWCGRPAPGYQDSILAVRK
jgi:SAM-dependent methyltransferase